MFDINQKIVTRRKVKQTKFREFFFVVTGLVKTCVELVPRDCLEISEIFLEIPLEDFRLGAAESTSGNEKVITPGDQPS